MKSRFTDLRRGIDGLAAIIRFRFHHNPYDKNTLFLLCGKRTDRIKVFFGKAMVSCLSTKGAIMTH